MLEEHMNKKKFRRYCRKDKPPKLGLPPVDTCQSRPGPVVAEAAIGTLGSSNI